LEDEHASARRAAAQVRVRVAVALAGRRERDLRASAIAFAKSKAAWHRACASASEAANDAADGHAVGVEPVPHRGFKAALLMTAFDDGLRAIFAREGISENLQPAHIPGLTERELLEADHDETSVSHGEYIGSGTGGRAFRG
jgi:hypothetical protein